MRFSLYLLTKLLCDKAAETAKGLKESRMEKTSLDEKGSFRNSCENIGERSCSGQCGVPFGKLPFLKCFPVLTKTSSCREKKPGELKFLVWMPLRAIHRPITRFVMGARDHAVVIEEIRGCTTEPE